MVRSSPNIIFLKSQYPRRTLLLECQHSYRYRCKTNYKGLHSSCSGILALLERITSLPQALGMSSSCRLGIVWDVKDLHFLAAQNLVLTTGRYDVNKSNNMGRNYFSYDEVVGFTWLDQKQGHEISFMAGYMINTKNQASDYTTGNEFHVDYTLAQYLSEHFGLGIVGYYYKQMTDDKSPTLDEINTINKAMGLLTHPVDTGAKARQWAPPSCGHRTSGART